MHSIDVEDHCPAVDSRVARSRFAALARRGIEDAAAADECARRLAERIEGLRIPSGLVLDAGCGARCGRHAAAALTREVVGVDWCAPLLSAGAVAADVQSLPFADASFGSIWCSLCLPWAASPPRMLAELRRVLADGGLCLIATLGPDSLREVRSAFADGRPHTMGLLDLHDLGDMLMDCGFAEPVVESETFTFEYANARSLLTELAAWGGLAAPGMHKGLTVPGTLKRAVATLEREASVRLTFEAVFAHAWAVPKRPGRFPEGWREISFIGPDMR